MPARGRLDLVVRVLLLISNVVLRAGPRRDVLGQSYVITHSTRSSSLMLPRTAVIVTFRQTHPIERLLNRYNSATGLPTVQIFGALLGRNEETLLVEIKRHIFEKLVPVNTLAAL